eukprot:767672-Hanusia_phi.AAC.3
MERQGTDRRLDRVGGGTEVQARGRDISGGGRPPSLPFQGRIFLTHPTPDAERQASIDRPAFRDYPPTDLHPTPHFRIAGSHYPPKISLIAFIPSF